MPGGNRLPMKDLVLEGVSLVEVGLGEGCAHNPILLPFSVPALVSIAPHMLAMATASPPLLSSKPGCLV